MDRCIHFYLSSYFQTERARELILPPPYFSPTNVTQDPRRKLFDVASAHTRTICSMTSKVKLQIISKEGGYHLLDFSVRRIIEEIFLLLFFIAGEGQKRSVDNK